MKLYSYWRSSAAYRARIALNLKGLDWEYVSVDLAKGDQNRQAYASVNPQMIVPMLDDDGTFVRQSLAVLEYLEETHPKPPLLPASPGERARVRAIAQYVACEMHPLNTMTIHGYMRNEMGLDEEAITKWYMRWTTRGLTALEESLAGDPATGTYCHGDTPTMADACIVPHLYNTKRFGVDLSPYPTLVRIDKACLKLPAFAAAVPDRQPDFVPG
jgi:maleylacetoacetate isomerase